MFDARNKSQPKLVYAHAHQKDLQNDQVQPTLKSTHNIAEIKEGVKNQPSLQPDTKIQPNPNLQPLQYQKEQTQQPDMQKPTPQQIQAKQNAGDFIQTKKESSVTESVVQKDAQMKTSKQPLNNPGNDSSKRPLQTTPNGNPIDSNTKREQYEEFRLYRGREFEINRDKMQITENVQRSSSSKESERKLIVPPSPTIRHVSVSNSIKNDSGQVNFLRHPRTNGSGSPVQRNRPQTHPPPPNPHAHQQQLLYQQQQYQFKQMQLQQQMLRDHSIQNEQAKHHGQVFRLRSYPAGRQQMPSSLHPNSQKPVNTGQSLNIPRVSPSVSVRPHSLTLPPSRPQDGVPGSQHNQTDFSNYNPSASPRALRSHVRLDSDSSLGQGPPSNASSSSAASNPPKSILKNNLSLEQSDLYLASRPLVLPRAHSEKNRSYMARDFDFSSILTANKDPLTAKVTNIQVKGQVLGQTIAPANATLSQSQRPATAGSSPVNSELNQNVRPIRKSVTFNSLVQLHHDQNQISPQ